MSSKERNRKKIRKKRRDKNEWKILDWSYCVSRDNWFGTDLEIGLAQTVRSG
jgi:hypothetical protein